MINSKQTHNAHEDVDEQDADDNVLFVALGNERDVDFCSFVSDLDGDNDDADSLKYKWCQWYFVENVDEFETNALHNVATINFNLFVAAADDQHRVSDVVYVKLAAAVVVALDGDAAAAVDDAGDGVAHDCAPVRQPPLYERPVVTLVDANDDHHQHRPLNANDSFGVVDDVHSVSCH